MIDAADEIAGVVVGGEEAYRLDKTGVFGVWAAGNVVDPRAQVITAAGAGSAAPARRLHRRGPR